MDVETKIENLKSNINEINLKIASQQGGMSVLIEKIESLTTLLMEMKNGISQRVQLHDTDIAIIHNDLKFIKYEKLSKIDESLTEINEKIDDKFQAHEREHVNILRWIIATIVTASVGFLHSFWKAIFAKVF